VQLKKKREKKVKQKEKKKEKQNLRPKLALIGALSLSLSLSLSLMANYNCSSSSSSGLLVLLVSFLLLQNLRGSCASNGSSARNLLGAARTRIPNCADLVSESQCSRNPECRWCQSQSLDDTCFPRLEAWRLPQQVFSCD
jgi:hypothetical protein